MDQIVSETDFVGFWKCSIGNAAHAPFPYQSRLAMESWPDLLKIPTGLGKTAGVVLAWIYKRLQNNQKTPRRLVYCLPMRTLVEQTAANTRAWLRNTREAGFDPAGLLPAGPHVLMGGEVDDDWIRSPEKPAILIGTQDLLLSRALMRGYGVSRGRRPVDFALLHHDAMWVFDEVQLMAAGVPTSAQLEAFRGQIGRSTGCRSLWMSATLEREWLRTVDLDASRLTQRKLEEDDRAHPIARKRLGAPKTLRKAGAAVTSATLKSAGMGKHAKALADEVLSRHRPGKATLVILNRVDRAQALHGSLGGRPKAEGPSLHLIHSRFRPAERAELNKQLSEQPGAQGRIVVATQAVEAGVDMTSAVLFTELAPWASLVQRFGRLNRAGEEADAQAFWIDLATTDSTEKGAIELALPYTPEELASARERLLELSEVSPRTLETYRIEANASWQVLRRKDLYELFDTDPDLTGFDVDVSPYVRGADDTDVRVFWRTIADLKEGPQGKEAEAPHRDELCAVNIGQAKTWLESSAAKGRAFTWDWVDNRWIRLDRVWPGSLVLVDAELGGYDATRGFDTTSKARVPAIERDSDVIANDSPDGSDGDSDTVKEATVLLPDHLCRVRDEARALCSIIDVPVAEAEAIVTAALWHDVGKAHDVFKARCGLGEEDAPLAKTHRYDWRRASPRNRRHFRHELASALAWLNHGPPGETHDLVAYLIAAHHGKVRMGLRALPDERGPDDDPKARFARGVFDGDPLPAISVDSLALPDTKLTLDIMEIGGGATGRSWATRTLRLLEHYGPFRLAFLEALVRIADWRASQAEQQGAVEKTQETENA